ncbi:MAG: molybdopterin-dependent oxidoreductase [Halobacteriales archaeon]|nr:molybdopterin-dependent oxidoreductase [Halobacteriales archaeon]
MRDRVADRLPALEPVLLALAAGAAGVAGSFAVAGFTPDFVAGPIAGLMARALPGAVITFSIVVLGDLGTQLSVLGAIALAVALFAAAAGAGWALGHRLGSRALGSAIAGLLTGAAALLVTGAVLPSLTAGLVAGLVLSLAAVGGTPTSATAVSPARRRVLVGMAGALAFVVGGSVLGSRVNPVGAGGTDGESLSLSPSLRADADAKLAQASDLSLAVDGLEPLVSDTFYTVDINATDPALAADDWTLSVTGAVDEELTYTYDDILAREPENQFVSLRCVGESLNGRKMDNALWTGIPIMDLVEPAGVEAGCCVMLRAADGFYEEFPLSALQDGFLAYGMNGNALPRGHGYPARALIPGHWGEINVKWLTEIEILDQEADGYWEERGWHGTGPVNTVAKLHVQNRLDDGRLEVGGHAYAGTRGIRTVEVSTDGGASWAEATLSESLPGDDVWRQWIHRYEPPDAAHEVVVRAIDGDGVRQPREESSSFPSGPSGWVKRTIRP